MVEIVADVMKPLQTTGVALVPQNTQLLSTPTPSGLSVSPVFTPGEPDSTIPARKMTGNPHRRHSMENSRTLEDIMKRSSSAAAEGVKKGKGSDGVVLAMRRVGLWKLREQAKQITLMEVIAFPVQRTLVACCC